MKTDKKRKEAIERAEKYNVSVNKLKQEVDKNPTLQNIEDRLYNLNRNISLLYIGLEKTPTQEEMKFLNDKLGKIIKQIREIRENGTN